MTPNDHHLIALQCAFGHGSAGPWDFRDTTVGNAYADMERAGLMRQDGSCANGAPIYVLTDAGKACAALMEYRLQIARENIARELEHFA